MIKNMKSKNFIDCSKQREKCRKYNDLKNTILKSNKTKNLKGVISKCENGIKKHIYSNNINKFLNITKMILIIVQKTKINIF